MRQLFGIIVFVPLALIIGIFAVENRGPLTLEIWPLPGVQEMWASVWILGLLAIGIIVGLVIGWLAGGSARRRGGGGGGGGRAGGGGRPPPRRAERLNRTLERQLLERDAEPTPANAPANASDVVSASPNVSSAALPAPSGRAAQVARTED
jgi:hypothetical protein